MRVFYRTVLLAAVLLTAAGCRPEKYTVLDIPLGVRTVAQSLLAYDVESNEEDETRIRATRDFDFNDDEVFGRLKYYRDEKDITMDVWDMKFGIRLRNSAVTDAEAIKDVLMVASVGEREIGRYAIALVDDFPFTVTDDEDYGEFVTAVFDAVIGRETVTIECSGTLLGFKSEFGGSNYADYIMTQEITSHIRIKR